ncbi:uncharacterized protein LOC134180247 [Corticium candelabrum]|uniref:uncharacterized protein LOC134180247 n=1 Tax=Corticium candelabrum TaxID=121492 RepID=UPI002E27309F|nr:uncharacterized protein LOC134180247 [Corticium candelabrum]
MATTGTASAMDKEVHRYRDDPVFSLAGAIPPNYVPCEFSVDKCKTPQIVPCGHKGLVQFGQPPGYPEVTSYHQSTSASAHRFEAADQPDLGTEESTTIVFAQDGWKVKRNKVCIQADVQLICGSNLDHTKWSDNFVFAFFQTLEYSSTCLTYRDPDNKDNTMSIAKKYEPHHFPILDVNTFLGQKSVGRNCRPWAPYFSTVSKVNLKGMVGMVEKENEAKAKANRIIKKPPTIQAVSALISMGDTPSVVVPQSMTCERNSLSPPSLRDGNLCAATEKNLFVFSSVQHHERYRSWIAVHDKTLGTVWPLTMFEWCFDVSAYADGSKMVFDSDTPIEPAMPEMYSISTSSLEFPQEVLQKDSDGYYVVANDYNGHWSEVYV